MLGANPSPQIGRADKSLREVGIELRGKDTFHKNDVGIFFGTPDKTVPDPYFDGKAERTGCTFCGSCMIGCPVGAKNTLDKNYLYLAEGNGVRIIPETEVTGVRPWNGGYEIITRKSTGLRHPESSYRARGVVFSGGVMGSVKLLMKCNHAGPASKHVEQLGNFVRTNSEAILGVKSKDKSVDWNDQIAITSGIYADATTHIEMVRYNKGSDVLLNLLTLMTDGGGIYPAGCAISATSSGSRCSSSNSCGPWARRQRPGWCWSCRQTKTTSSWITNPGGGGSAVQHEFHDSAGTKTRPDIYPYRQRGGKTPGKKNQRHPLKLCRKLYSTPPPPHTYSEDVAWGRRQTRGWWALTV